ncbi:MAG: hypothetical protein ABJN26_06070 [Stappiaceae bacterium]
MRRREFLAATISLTSMGLAFAQNDSAIPEIESNVNLPGHRESVSDLVFGPDGTLYSLSRNMLAVWDWPSGKTRAQYSSNKAHKMIYDSELDRMILWTEQGMAFVFDLTKKTVQNLVSPANPQSRLSAVSNASIHPSIELYAFTHQGGVSLFERQSLEPYDTIAVSEMERVGTFTPSAITPDLSLIFWVESDGLIKSLRLPDAEIGPEFGGHRGASQNFMKLSVSADSSKFVSSDPTQIISWDTKTGKEISRVAANNHDALKVHSLDKPGQLILAGGRPLGIYDLLQNQMQTILKSGLSFVYRAKANSDFSAFAASDDKGRIVGWNLSI